MTEQREEVKGGGTNGGVSPGDGTCPCDRCCPDLVRGSTVGNPLSSPTDACLANGIENHEEGRSVRPKIQEKDDAHNAQSGGLFSSEAKCMFDGFETELSHSKWCSWLLMMVFRTRTPFAVFLKSTLNLPRSSTSASALFPIPCPLGVMFGRMPPGISAKSRARIHYGRVLHVLVVALNYWHFGGFCGELSAMGRAPTSAHLRIYSRLRSFIRSDCGMPPVMIAKAGRRFPQLVARLSEISESVTKLGLSGDPYSKAFQGAPVEEQKEKIPELQPYRDLDADRIALHGRGHWDITPHLSDALVMAYREPNSILIDRTPEPWEYPIFRDSQEMLLKLAKKWDQNNLLVLHADPSTDMRPFEKVRIFNNYKSREVDRQIGDRRGRNAIEYKVESVSEGLPAGTHLCDALVDPASETLRVSVSDRKDYYHQIACSKNRASRNTIGAIARSDAEQFGAFGVFLQQKAISSYSRNKHGDLLRGNGRPLRKVPDALYMAFGAILEGDHAGVEFATCAHSRILEDGGAIEEPSHLLATKTLRSGDKIQGLVIDDYFSISTEKQHVPGECSDSARRHQRALEIYNKFGLLGSPQKDISAVEKGRVIGAEIDSSQATRRKGIAKISSPAEKRYALSWLTFLVAQLGVSSDALHLALLGGWTSVAMFRRPLMGLMSQVFHVVDVEKFSPGSPRLVHLSREVKDELVMLAVFAPLFVANVGAGFGTLLFATDASIGKGAIVQTSAPVSLQMVLHRVGKTKGAYSKLSSLEEQDAELRSEWAAGQTYGGGPNKPLAYNFDFIEIYAGSGKVTFYMSEMNWVVGPPIDLSESDEFNLEWHHVMRWLSFLISHKRIRAFMVEPPCTTYSIMRRPALRTKEKPFGIDPYHPQTRTGTILGQRGFQCLALGDRYAVPGLLETPNSSKLKNMPSWRHIAGLQSSSQVRTDSCCFGSPHLKPFRFLSVRCHLEKLNRRCSGGHEHIRIEGSLTRSSAVYTDQLAEALAEVLNDAILANTEAEEDRGCSGQGLENLLVNDIAKTSMWSLRSVWPHKKEARINILEMGAVVKLVNQLTIEKGSQRIVALVDSSVARGALAKGRSSSRCLSTCLRRYNSICIAGDLYVTTPYCPTRLNVADDPTRDRPPREPVRGCGSLLWSTDELFDFAELGSMNRCCANWAMMVIAVLGPKILHNADRAEARIMPLPYQHPGSSIQFDSSLGFPGEGPNVVGLSFSSRNATLFHQLGFFEPLLTALGFFFWGCHRICHVFSPSLLCLLFLSVLSLSPAEAMPIAPRNAADASRAAQRQFLGEPTLGRIVRPATSTLRESLLRSFLDWTREENIPWDELLNDGFRHLEEINLVIIRFGKQLHASGRPYLHYVETINAISASRMSLKRGLQGAWSLAFGWLQQEPVSHHIAMPFQILLAMVSVSLLWGWHHMAGVLSLTWGSLLRAGEIIGAFRSQLMLPIDVDFTINFAAFSIPEPKTRHIGPKHQYSKLDIPDLLQIVEIIFGRMGKDQRLWPHSGQTLRTRFRTILGVLGLPVSRGPHGKPLDLGSLRAGGATWCLSVTEDAERVRRKGRWLSTKTMEIYIQETSANLYLANLPSDTKERIITLAKVFPWLLRKSTDLYNAKIPHSAWRLLYTQGGRVEGQMG